MELKRKEAEVYNERPHWWNRGKFFLFLLPKNLMSTQEKLDTFDGFSLHAEPLDVHVVSMLIDTGILSRYSDVNASFGILMIIWLPGYFVLPCHSSIPKSVIPVSFSCSCTRSFTSACSLHCLSCCPMYWKGFLQPTCSPLAGSLLLKLAKS